MSTVPATEPDEKVLRKCGEMSEWLKEHAWKACIR